MAKVFGFKNRRVAQKLKGIGGSFYPAPTVKPEGNIPEVGLQPPVYICRVPESSAGIQAANDDDVEPPIRSIHFADCEIYKFVEQDEGGWKLEPLYDVDPDEDDPEDEGEIAFRPVFNVFNTEIGVGEYIPVFQELTSGRFFAAWAPQRVKFAIFNLGPNQAEGFDTYPEKKGEDDEASNITVIPNQYPVSSIFSSNVDLGLSEEEEDSLIVSCGFPFYLKENGRVLAVSIEGMEEDLTFHWSLVSPLPGTATEFILKGTLDSSLASGGSVLLNIEGDDQDQIKIWEVTGLANPIPADTTVWVRYNFDLLKWALMGPVACPA